MVAFALVASFLVSTGPIMGEGLGPTLDLTRLYKDGRYLLLFQNNTEARSSGGFIGSFATIEIKNKRIKNINFETNVYKEDKKFLVQSSFPAPDYFQEFIPGLKMSFINSNYQLDFPESAQTIQFFYHKAWNDTVDGIVALNATTIVELLKITGPIPMPAYNIVISADNFLKEIQYKVEKEYFQDPANVAINEPKTILKDLYPLVMAKIKPHHWPEIYRLVFKELAKKQILFYFNDPARERTVLNRNWGGKISDTSLDYLLVANNNLGGAKSSLNVLQDIEYNVTAGDLNQLKAVLKIVRTHTGDGKWPDDINRNYSRILTPLGSVLESVLIDNEDVTPKVKTTLEANKTSFGLWTTVHPKKTITVTLIYQLPLRGDNYQLTVQKQPGALGNKLTINFNNQNLFQGLLDRDLTLKR